MGYIITYDKCLIIWERPIQTDFALITTEVEYISLYQAMREVIPFVSIMKKIEFVLKLQGYNWTVLCSLFENPVAVYKDNEGEISAVVSQQMLPRTKHITIKYHHFRSFVANGDVDIKHVDTT